MNKKLLAIAVGAAMVAGASAATAGDEPTFYGKIHMSIDSMDNGGASSAPPDNEGKGVFVASNSSRLGIKGKVDLDGGLAAVYKYEMTTDYSDSGAVNGNRNAYLGLSGGFGTVLAGRHDMPFKTIGRKHDLFGDTIGDSRALLRGNVAGDDFADRRDDIIMYKGKFDMVAVDVAYGSPQGVDDAADTGIRIAYDGGPFGIQLATEQHAYATNNSTGNAIAGHYKLGNMKFLATYGTISDAGGSSADSSQLKGWSLGASMKAGMNTFKIQYVSSDTDADDTDATQISLGADHAFSKKTKAYVVYSSISTGDARSDGFASTGHAGTVANGAAGESSTGISVGMVHKF
jgi:predicted porin